MLTPAHLPELERLLASLVDAYEATNVESGIALRTGDEGAFTVASMRLDCAARSLVAFTRAAQSAPPAPVDGPGWRIATDGGGWPRAALGGTWDRPDLAVSADGEDLYVGEHEVPIDIVLAVLERARPAPVDREIERLAVEMAALTVRMVGRPDHDSDPSTAVISRYDLCSICDGLLAQDARIADLERDLADTTANALRWQERCRALEAGLREAASALQDWMPSSDAARDVAIRLRALADG